MKWYKVWNFFRKHILCITENEKDNDQIIQDLIGDYAPYIDTDFVRDYADWMIAPDVGTWRHDNRGANLQKNVVLLPGGGVKIKAMREDCLATEWTPDQEWITHQMEYSQGCMEYKNKLGYGRYIIEAEFPDFLNAWSALWLWDGGDNWYQEIDIAEHFWKSLNKSKQISPGIYNGKSHPSSYHYSEAIKCVNPSQRLVYCMGWYPDRIVVSINGIKVFECMDNIPDMDLRFGIGVGIAYWHPMKHYELNEEIGSMRAYRFVYIPFDGYLLKQ